MPTARTTLRFAALFALIFGLLIAPWPRLENAYGWLFRAIAQKACGIVTSTGLMVFQPNSLPAAQTLDTRVFIGNRNLLQPDGTGPGSRIELSSRQIGYLPTALVMALILSSPVPMRRKLRAMLTGLLLIHCFVGLTLAIVLLQQYNQEPALSLFIMTPAWRWMLNAAYEVLVLRPDSRYVVALILWIAVSFRRGNLQSLGVPCWTQAPLTPLKPAGE